MKIMRNDVHGEGEARGSKGAMRRGRGGTGARGGGGGKQIKIKYELK